jgi:hypothetical protein
MMTTIGTPRSQRMTLFIRVLPEADANGTTELICKFLWGLSRRVKTMHELIYLVGLVVVVMFILSALGLH